MARLFHSYIFVDQCANKEKSFPVSKDIDGQKRQWCANMNLYLYIIQGYLIVPVPGVKQK